MSFFGETKNFGIVFTIAELVAFVCAIVAIVTGLIDTKDFNNEVIGMIVVEVGTIIASLITLVFAIGVLKGEYAMKFGRFVDDAKTPFGVLCGYLAIGGIAGIITGVTLIVGGIISGAGIASGDGILGIIVSILFLIIVAVMTDGKKTFADKLIFILLAVLFILALIGTILAVVGSIGILSEGASGILALVASIFGLLEALFVLVFLFSDSTKKALGI